jgi:hypothetical protein
MGARRQPLAPAVRSASGWAPDPRAGPGPADASSVGQNARVWFPSAGRLVPTAPRVGMQAVRLSRRALASSESLSRRGCLGPSPAPRSRPFNRRSPSAFRCKTGLMARMAAGGLSCRGVGYFLQVTSKSDTGAGCKRLPRSQHASGLDPLRFPSPRNDSSIRAGTPGEPPWMLEARRSFGGRKGAQDFQSDAHELEERGSAGWGVRIGGRASSQRNGATLGTM